MRVVVALLCLVGCVGCGGPPTSGPLADLAGTSWTLERVVLPGGDVLRGDGGEVTFGTDGSLNVTSCNSCNGRYRLRADYMEVAPLACTRKACLDGQPELERYLIGTVQLERDGSYLVLNPMTETGEPTAQILLVPSGAR